MDIIEDSHPRYLNESSYILERSLIKSIFLNKNIIAINKKSIFNSNTIDNILKKEVTNKFPETLKVNFI